MRTDIHINARHNSQRATIDTGRRNIETKTSSMSLDLACSNVNSSNSSRK